MQIKKLVIHHSASPRDTTTVAQISAWHKKRGFSQIGYHKVILGNGKIQNGRPETTMGAHAKGANQNSLGVCLTGNFEKETPSAAQLISLVSTLADWCRAHRLNTKCIYGHYNVPGGVTATACPGKNLKSQFNTIKKAVQKQLPKFAIEYLIQDKSVQRALRKALADGKLSFAETQTLIESSFDGNKIYPRELNDLKLILENSASLGVASKSLVRKFLANPNGFMRYGVSERLLFDGKTLKWYHAGREPESWPAVSGRSGYQTKAHQKTKDKGPLPEGIWHVRQNQYQKMPSRNWIEKIGAELGRTAWPGGESSWGKNRIWLHPKSGTSTHGRSGFSIHGGEAPGSAGCVDLTTSMPDFAAKFLQHGRDLELVVKY